MCFCGHVGWLERIVSSEFLARQNGHAHGPKPVPAPEGLLMQRVAAYGSDVGHKDAGLETVLQYLACGLANAINFVLNSATQITAFTPSHVVGLVHVRVATRDGTSAPTAADQFTYH